MRNNNSNKNYGSCKNDSNERESLSEFVIKTAASDVDDDDDDVDA